MQVGELAALLKDRIGAVVAHGAVPSDQPVRGVAYHSERVRPGDVFVAWRGARFDGHAFVGEAFGRGAVGAIVEREVSSRVPGPTFQVDSSRAAMAVLAAEVADHPTSDLGLVGVTGTNGKTTTSFLLREVLASRASTGLVGTVTVRVGDTARQVRLTTPESADLQPLFRDMVGAGDQYCVMEVSSLALATHRVDAVAFDVAVFTNLTADHIGPHEHPDFDHYRDSKALLFRRVGQPVPGARPKSVPTGAVVNADDPAGPYMAGATPSSVRVIRYGIGPQAELRAEGVRCDRNGSRFDVVYPGGHIPCQLHLPGRYNVCNALGAFGAGLILGFEPESIVAALSRVAGVPGRLEPIPGDQPFSVLVDYAHTPDGLENVLRAARELSAGRVIAVFGCGGDRDHTKRPVMGAIGVRMADVVWLTSDNPRTERPEEILRQVEAGARGGGGSYRVVPDRRQAIREAIAAAGPGDVVVIAGKGHETYQIFADRTIHFDDREEAKQALEALGYR